MTAKNDRMRLSVRRTMFCAAAIAVLAACETSEPSGECAWVAQQHLAVQRDGGGQTRICSPNRVNANYRDRYFPPDAGSATTQ